jgi:Aldo/keto reductases, related to diketogulonate reductase
MHCTNASTSSGWTGSICTSSTGQAPCGTRYVDSWLALEELQDEGLAQSIGVSNFQPEHLDRLAAASSTVPAVNQVELHPYFQQRELRGHHERAGILTESWGPLGQGKYSLADIPEIHQIATESGATAAQVVLRWHLQEGLIVIPKSVSTDRLRENLAVGDVELSSDQMELMRGLERGQRLGPDPSEATF